MKSLVCGRQNGFAYIKYTVRAVESIRRNFCECHTPGNVTPWFSWIFHIAVLPRNHWYYGRWYPMYNNACTSVWIFPFRVCPRFSFFFFPSLRIVSLFSSIKFISCLKYIEFLFSLNWTSINDRVYSYPRFISR